MPATIPLPALKQLKIGALQREVSKFILARYDQAEQNSLNALMIEALRRVPAWSNRQALIAQVHDWISTALDEYFAKKAVVNAATTTAQVAVVSLDLTAVDIADPKVSLQTVRSTRS